MTTTIIIEADDSASPESFEVALYNPTKQAMECDAAFLATWLHGKAEKTQRAYAADLRKLYEFVGKPLEQMTLIDLQAFVDSLIDLRPASQARTIAAVKSAFSFATKTGYLQFNVGAVVKLPKLENKLAERIMTKQAVARLLALEADTRNHAILSLLYHGGLRAQELCDLQWRQLQERGNAGQVAVFGKGRKTRFVLLDDETWQELQALRPDDATPDVYVFQSRQANSRSHTGDIIERNHRLDEETIWKIVRSAAKRARIPGNVSPHWLRHCHASHAIDAGAPVTLVADTLGHASIATTSKYVHVRPNTSSSQFLKI